jgi:multiple sugar transport system permease protein
VVSDPVRDVPAVAGASRRRASVRLLGRDWALGWAFVAPLLVVIVALVAYPFVSGIILSLQNQVLGGTATWAGLGNYRALIVGKEYGGMFREALLVSLLYTVVAIAIKFVLGLCVALMLNERFRGRTLVRTVLFLPWAMPTVIVALDWRWIYDGTPHGLLNIVLHNVFGADPVQFLSNPSLALWSVVAVVVWQGTPFYTMMFLAGLQAIPAAQYEAAAIDGAGPLARFRYITLPGLVPAMIVTTLLSAIWTANSLNFVYALTGGGPLNKTTTFPMLAYRIGLTGAGQLGISAAVSVILLPLFVVLIYLLTRRMLATESGVR